MIHTDNHLSHLSCVYMGESEKTPLFEMWVCAELGVVVLYLTTYSYNWHIWG